jgi:hypothetical protein
MEWIDRLDNNEDDFTTTRIPLDGVRDLDDADISTILVLYTAHNSIGARWLNGRT